MDSDSLILWSPVWGVVLVAAGCTVDGPVHQETTSPTDSIELPTGPSFLDLTNPEPETSKPGDPKWCYDEDGNLIPCPVPGRPAL